jgi:hypothetical protein
MTTHYEKLGQLAKLISDGLNSKKNAVTQDALGHELVIELIKDLERVWQKISAARGPTAQDLRVAKSHPIAAQIKQFTELDKDRKAFFNVDYFRKKIDALPPESRRFLKGEPKTVGQFREALVLYHYLRGKRDGDDDKGLEALRESLVADFRSSPAEKDRAEAYSLLRRLLQLADEKLIEKALLERFPTEDALKVFAKTVNRKIPTNKKGRPKVSGHVRLAQSIASEGPIRNL